MSIFDDKLKDKSISYYKGASVRIIRNLQKSLAKKIEVEEENFLISKIKPKDITNMQGSIKGVNVNDEKIGDFIEWGPFDRPCEIVRTSMCIKIGQYTLVIGMTFEFIYGENDTAQIELRMFNKVLWRLHLTDRFSTYEKFSSTYDELANYVSMHINSRISDDVIYNDQDFGVKKD